MLYQHNPLRNKYHTQDNPLPFSADDYDDFFWLRWHYEHNTIGEPIIRNDGTMLTVEQRTYLAVKLLHIPIGRIVETWTWPDRQRIRARAVYIVHHADGWGAGPPFYIGTESELRSKKKWACKTLEVRPNCLLAYDYHTWKNYIVPLLYSFVERTPCPKMVHHSLAGPTTHIAYQKKNTQNKKKGEKKETFVQV